MFFLIFDVAGWSLDLFDIILSKIKISGFFFIRIFSCKIDFFVFRCCLLVDQFIFLPDNSSIIFLDILVSIQSVDRSCDLVIVIDETLGIFIISC